MKCKPITELLLWRNCNNNCHFCFDETTPILMSDFTTKAIKDIKIGDKIIGISNSNKSTISTVTAVMSRKINENGNFIDGHFVTKEHPFKFYGRSQIYKNKYAPINYVLKSAERSICRSILPEISEVFSEQYKVGYFVGCWMGDGSFHEYKDIPLGHPYKGKDYTRDAYRVRFTVKDIEATNRLAKIMTNFGIDYNIREFDFCNGESYPAISSTKRATYNKIKAIVDKNFGKNDGLDYLCGYLAGQYDSDGSIANKGNISIVDSNPAVIQETERGLQALSIDYKKTQSQRGRKTALTIFRIHAIDAAKFISSVKPAIIRKRWFIGKISTAKYRPQIAEQWYSGSVYNIETTTHNYIANKMVVHNCFQKHPRKEEHFLDEYRRVDSMAKAVNVVKSDKFQPGSHVLLVGGELFDTKFSENTERVFKYFFKQFIDWMVEGHIDLLYINTNLLYKDTTYLTKYLLDPIKKNKLFDRLKFTTSYDVYGRFTEERPASLVESNLKLLKKKYPDIHIVVNMIMTKQFCEAVLSGSLSVKDFKAKYGVEVNTIPYIILTEDMAATREQIYTTLAKLNEDEPGYIKAYVQNIALPQEKHLYEYNGKEFVYMTANNAPCGHNENFHLYTPAKDRCFVCDMLDLGELYV